MHLIDDIHLIAAALRQIHRTFPEIPDVLHAVVGRCVDLDDVCQRSTLCVPADLAFQTGIPFRGAVLAVHRLCQDTGAGGLSCTTGAGKEVGVGCFFFPDLIPERCGDVRL